VISVENRKFFPLRMYFAPPTEGVHFGIGCRRMGSEKTRVMDLPGRTRSLTISSAVWIQSTNVTDRWDTGRQQRPRLRIASRG